MFNTLYSQSISLKTKHSASIIRFYLDWRKISLSLLVRECIKSWIVFLTIMCEKVVISAMILCDIGVIFVARQRDSLQIFLLRESGDRPYFVRRHCEALVIFTTIRDPLWNLFLISRLYFSVHFDLMAAVGQDRKPAVECKGCVLFYVSYV